MDLKETLCNLNSINHVEFEPNTSLETEDTASYFRKNVSLDKKFLKCVNFLTFQHLQEVCNSILTNHAKFDYNSTLEMEDMVFYFREKTFFSF